LNIKSNRFWKGRRKREGRKVKEKAQRKGGVALMGGVWAQMGKIQEKVGPKAKHV